MDGISEKLVQPRRRRPRGRRLNARGVYLIIAILAFLITGSAILWPIVSDRVRLRFAETFGDPTMSADEGLPAFCFLPTASIAVIVGVAIYRSGPRQGFVAASVISASTLLLLLWALSASREPLQAIRLRDVTMVDVVYVSTFFLVAFVPALSFLAWYLSMVRQRD